MKRFAILLACATLAFGAQATPQQDKMKTCNAEAKGKKGDERKAFMKDCLSASGTPTGAKMTQQDKMKTCNVGATDKKLKGDDRKMYMKTCLSAAAPA
jgi:hypothetical protein